MWPGLIIRVGAGVRSRLPQGFTSGSFFFLENYIANDALLAHLGHCNQKLECAEVAIKLSSKN